MPPLPSSQKRQQARLVRPGGAPFSAEAEKAVLGAIFSHGDHLITVQSEVLLEPEHFFVGQHQQIYRAMCALQLIGAGVDFVAVVEELKNQDKYPLAVRTEYVVDLLEAAPLTENVVYHAQIVRNTSQLRQIIQTCEETRQLAARQSYEDIQELLESLERDLLAIRSFASRGGGLIRGSEVLESTVISLEQRMSSEGLPGITSGFYDLDEVTGGFQKSDLIILAARPGMGKTALILNWAAHALADQKRVSIFSLEMSKEQLMERILASEGRIDSAKIRRGDLKSASDTEHLLKAVREVRGFSDYLMVDDTPSITLSELSSRCRRAQLERGLDMVIVDYLQLMVGSKDLRKQGREREVSEISMGLKALAKELAVPVIAAAQLNRSPDNRPDKRPKISDLRESGSMEQDADLVMFIYRDEYYNPSSESHGQAEVIIGKNRHGPLQTVELAYIPRFVSFRNLAFESHAPHPGPQQPPSPQPVVSPSARPSPPASPPTAPPPF